VIQKLNKMGQKNQGLKKKKKKLHNKKIFFCTIKKNPNRLTLLGAKNPRLKPQHQEIIYETTILTKTKGKKKKKTKNTSLSLGEPEN
jgi:hypothetical protein